MENTAYMERGALWLILHASRIFGLAPLHFTSFRNGYSISLSRLHLLYSYFFVTILNIIFLQKYFLFEMRKSFITSFRFNSANLHGLDNFIDIIASVFIVSVGCYGVMGRMKYIIQHLDMLEKIKALLNDIQRLNSPEIGLLVNTLGYFIAVVGTLFLFAICERDTDNHLDAGRRLYSVYILEYLIILLLQLQVLLIHLEVTTFLKMMNAKMRNLLHISKTDCTSSTINDGVRSLIQSYVSICDLTTRMNSSDGLLIFLIFNYHIFLLIRSGYSFTELIVTVYSEEPHDIKLHTLFFLFAALNIVISVLPSHDIKNKIVDMRADLCHLMYNVKPLGLPVPTGLVLFHKQLILNEPFFAPLDIFTLNRSFVGTIFSAAITYLLLVLRLQGNVTDKTYNI